ncbi:MAG: hypothetical protein WD295_03880, partial [Bacteroidota bacterium]
MRSLAVLCVLLLWTGSLHAQRFQGRFVTSAYGWEKQDSVGVSSAHVYGFQSVQLSLAQGDVIAGTSFQAFNDFAGPVKNDPILRLYNLYLKWKDIGGMGELSAGRQAIFAGAGNGTIDGATAGIRLKEYGIRLLGYAGAIVPAGGGTQFTRELNDNQMYGGQLIASPLEYGTVSVSYTNKRIRPDSYLAWRADSLFNPYQVEIRPTAEHEQILSADLNMEYDNRVSGYLRYDHDLNREAMARIQAFARVKVLDDLGITGEVLQREPRLSYSSIFSVFTYNTLKEYEVGLEYELPDAWQVFGKYGSVSYG